MSDAPTGEMRLMRARDLTIIREIQREPTPDRLRKFEPWDEAKVGILLASKITDGEFKGKVHPYDGGTRILFKQQNDPDYVFRVWVEETTYEEAARRFLYHNQLQMKPSAFFRYRVGLQAKEPVPIAIKKALDTVGLIPSKSHSTYGNGVSGDFAALTAAERIIGNYTKAYGQDETDAASDHLAWVLTQTRIAYPQHGDPGAADAHDADLIQAISYIGLTYPQIVDNDEMEHSVRHATTTWLRKDTQLFKRGDLMRPTSWRLALLSAKGTGAGSSSRGIQMGTLIVTNHNADESVPLRLRKQRSS